MSAVYAFIVAVFVCRTLPKVPKVLLSIGEHERDAALHHHERRGAVLAS